MEVGPWSEWVSGVLTAGALGFSFYQHWKATERLDRIEEKEQRLEAERMIASERRHANAVTAWFESPSVAAVRNAGDAVIYDVIVALRRSSHSEESAGPAAHPWVEVASVVPPGRTARMEIQGGWGAPGFRPAIEAAFRDAAGIWWVRGHRGTLSELHGDPYQRYGLALPFSYSKADVS